MWIPQYAYTSALSVLGFQGGPATPVAPNAPAVPTAPTVAIAGPSLGDVMHEGNVAYSLLGQMPGRDISSFSMTSKDMQRSVEQNFDWVYLQDNLLDWSRLIKDVARIEPGQRGSLVWYTLHHWPTSDDCVTSTLLQEAQNHFKAALQTSQFSHVQIPYIPGHLKLCSALIEVGVLHDYFKFPMQAFYHENLSTIKNYLLTSTADYTYEWVKELLDSGNERAVSNFTALFPSTRIVDGNLVPVMYWDKLKRDASLLLAIFYHQDTYQMALKGELLELIKNEHRFMLRKPLMEILMESCLTVDKLLDLDKFRHDYAEKRPHDMRHHISQIRFHDLFNHPKRMVEIMANRGFCQQSLINFDKLRAEDFTGPYADSIRAWMNEADFYQMALLAGVDDAFLIKTVQGKPKLAKALIYPAILNKRHPAFVKFLVRAVKGRFLAFPTGSQIPSKYMEALVANEEFAISFVHQFVKANNFDTCHSYDNFRLALHALSADALKGFLNATVPHANAMLEVVMLDMLFFMIITDKRAVIEEYMAGLCEEPLFKIALFAQSSEELKQMVQVIQNNTLKQAVFNAYVAKSTVRATVQHHATLKPEDE